METKNIRFALAKIITDQFAIIENAYSKELNVELKLGLQFGANYLDKVLSVRVTTLFEQQNIPFIIAEASCYFKIEPNDWELIIKDDEIVIPKGLITHLTVLTIGTIRGIMHAKTEGTNFNGFVLSTVNITEMIKEDVHIKIRD